MNEIQPKVQLARQFLKKLVKKVPSGIQDVDKQIYIGMDIITSLSIEEKALLKNLMDTILLKMRKCDASDIEIGGDGAKNQIWLRIHGKKSQCGNSGLMLPMNLTS